MLALRHTIYQCIPPLANHSPTRFGLASKTSLFFHSLSLCLIFPIFWAPSVKGILPVRKDRTLCILTTRTNSNQGKPSWKPVAKRRKAQRENMLRNNNSNDKAGSSSSASGSGSGGGGLFSNIKRLAKQSSSASSSKAALARAQQPEAPGVPKPLSKKATMNSQNLSHYTSGVSATSSDGDGGMASPEYTHSRTQSGQTSRFSYTSPSRRSSSDAKLAKYHTAQSSQNSIASQGSLSTLYNRFISPEDGKLRLEMPDDPAEVELLYEDIMYKRNILQNLPTDKQLELMNYDVKKKWLIVKQDLQNERKKLKTKTSSHQQTVQSAPFMNLQDTSSSASLPGQGFHDQQSVVSETSSRVPTTNDAASILSSATPSLRHPSRRKQQYTLTNKQHTVYPANGTAERHASSSSTLASDKTNRLPIHYVKKIIADQLSQDELNDLWVTLRTEQLDWVDAFLDNQGHIAMANVLMKSLYKTSPNVSLSGPLLDKEQSYFKCFKVLSMLAQGLREFTDHRLITDTIARGLFSSRLPTRKMATEIFVCMLETKNQTRFDAVITSLDQNFQIGSNAHMVNNLQKMPDYFIHLNLQSTLKVVQAWLFAIDQTLDGRGKMGSLVGASDEFKRIDGENSVLEYCQWTLVFVNKFCQSSNNLNQRMLLRTKLENAGFLRIMNKMKLLDYEKIRDQIEFYEAGKLDDFNSLLESQNKHANIDMQNPLSLLQNLWDACRGTDSENLLVSLVQHLFLSSTRLIQNNKDPTQLAKQLKLIDSLVTNVGSSVSAVADEETTMSMTIQRLFDSMQTDEVARRAIIESRTLTKKMEELQAEKDRLGDKLSKAEGGLVGELQRDIRERDAILAKNQRVNKQLENELEELKRKTLMEKHEHEVELRKMLTIINSKASPNLAQNPSASVLKSHDPKNKESLLSEQQSKIQKVLQDGLTRTKKDFTNDAKKFGMTVQPNKRLQLLRMKVEDIENEARQLEMTNFADIEKNATPVILTKGTKKKKSKKKLKTAQPDKKQRANQRNENQKIEALNKLRMALTAIQSESNDISKFNVEEHVNELFTERKFKALQRLRDLESKFNGLNTNFNIDDIIASTEKALTATDDGYSLDPRRADNKLDEIERLTNDLSKLHDSMKEQEQATLQSDNSSESSDSESVESDNEGSTVQSDVSEPTVGSGSFLASLSQKYETGQKQPNSPVTVNQKAFMTRLKRSSGAPLYLQELSKKIPQRPAFDESVDKVTLRKSTGDSNANSDGTTAKSLDKDGDDNTEQSTPEGAESIISSNGETSTPEGSADVAGSVPAPPPPPPPPPMPSLLTENKSNSSSPAPPPPPPPPPMTEGIVSRSSSSGAIPPPPPPPQATSAKNSPIPSPLFSQSSIFEKYPRPQKKLKQLHWEKLDSTNNSIWSASKAEKFADDLYEKGVLSNLEKAFAAREVKSLSSKKGDDSKITFLTRDVSQQFGINLHMFGNLSVEELVTKILKCDREVLNSPSVIEFLSKQEVVEVSVNLARNYSPYSTDWEGVKRIEDAKAPEKDPNELQRADQLYMSLMVNLQPYWSSRMRALKVITTYEREYAELLEKLRKVDKAVGSLQQSENLKNVLNVILAVGNYMNDTSKQAQGFKLATLQRLTFIKDTTNSMTFLNYVEKIVRKNYPTFNDFLNELQPVLDVVKISIDQLVSDCQEFSGSVVNVERSIEIGNLSDSSKFHPSDRVLVKVLPVLPEARKKADLLTDEVKLTMLEFNNLMQTYGEDSADKFAKNSFFKKFADFIQEYKKAQVQNVAAEEEEQQYERHKKIVEEQQRQGEEARKRLESASPDATNGEDTTAVDDETKDRRAIMDKLLEQLKNAGTVKADPSSARKRALARRKLLGDKDAASALLHDIDTDDDSLVYSPDTKRQSVGHLIGGSPTPGDKLLGSTPTKELSSPTAGQDDEDVTDRAKALLMELRGGQSSPMKKNAFLDEQRERIRSRRRRNELAGTEPLRGGNKLSFFEAETETSETAHDADNDTTKGQTADASDNLDSNDQLENPSIIEDADK
ncbi:formin BNI1 KNAG_0F00470 [Huiozyma naganishii CBS 8797]|uniref:FH2 domain-containing protein n=1 Tax=Huiozyma naganishii (strain ATCC MYA-139 / BCRC 22969 / CBS 8797 / KCTC 17520 / NBRC 10181 / NCYC 3082 / Yp74L-3) TaxID=1071383 RepID=J7S861_HUIN7|nr:hypothetical protein KNAG_0F00470 [Kazachstania naganishii CBS 8797]CCK70716.1 hypothetical protein KNAG_0F00470 [Kazachstania naganishii CBS 8797]